LLFRDLGLRVENDYSNIEKLVELKVIIVKNSRCVMA